MKVWKKNMVAAAVLVTVCAGIYVNWIYTEDSMAVSLTDTLDSEKVMSEDMLDLSEDMAAIAAGEDLETTAADYFAAVRLSRQQARASTARRGSIRRWARRTTSWPSTPRMDAACTPSACVPADMWWPPPPRKGTWSPMA